MHQEYYPRINEVAPDILFTKLVEIDFNNRKINTGELDILQKGLKLEEKGDVNAAITSYNRAGRFFIHVLYMMR